MATSGILGGTRPPQRPSGTDNEALGPSDSSDSGSDVQGERSMSTAPEDESMIGGQPADLNSDTDMSGTGERAGAFPDGSREDSDILPDRIEQPLGQAPDSLPDTRSARSIEDMEDEPSELAEDDTDETDDAPRP